MSSLFNPLPLLALALSAKQNKWRNKNLCNSPEFVLFPVYSFFQGEFASSSSSWTLLLWLFFARLGAFDNFLLPLGIPLHFPRLLSVPILCLNSFPRIPSSFLQYTSAVACFSGCFCFALLKKPRFSLPSSIQIPCFLHLLLFLLQIFSQLFIASPIINPHFFCFPPAIFLSLKLASFFLGINFGPFPPILFPQFSCLNVGFLLRHNFAEIWENQREGRRRRRK